LVDHKTNQSCDRWSKKNFEGCLIHPASRYTHITIAIAAISRKITSWSFNITETVTIARIKKKAHIGMIVCFFETTVFKDNSPFFK
jgi:hypothetical protein